MNRLPRRTSRIKPPLRGRLAAVLPPEQQQQYSELVIRKRPSKSRSFKNTNFEASDFQVPSVKSNGFILKSSNLNGNKAVEPVTSTSDSSDELWNRLVAMIILIILLVLIGSLF